MGRISRLFKHRRSAMNARQYLPDELLALSLFPNLDGVFRKTSEFDPLYNCLAWALGITWAWFSHETRLAGYYWPAGVPREWTVPAIQKIFAFHGYVEETANRDFEPGFEKIAFFVDSNNEPQHFAKQIANGKWSSKLGQHIDIEHENLECLENGDYGNVTLLLKRKAAGSI